MALLVATTLRANSADHSQIHAGNHITNQQIPPHMHVDPNRGRVKFGILSVPRDPIRFRANCMSREKRKTTAARTRAQRTLSG
jgi:hypothetical protein